MNTMRQARPRTQFYNCIASKNIWNRAEELDAELAARKD